MKPCSLFLNCNTEKIGVDSYANKHGTHWHLNAVLFAEMLDVVLVKGAIGET